MILKTEGAPEVAVMNWNELRQTLAGLHDDGNCFAILERPDGGFVQTAVTDMGMVVERSEGSLDRHFVAARSGSRTLSLADAEAIFRAYYDGSPMPLGVTWEKANLKPIPQWLIKLLWALPWLAVAYIAYDFARPSVQIWEWFR